MATLDDKILGCKSQNYVSSSESEGEDDNCSEDGEGGAKSVEVDLHSSTFRSFAPKTGPKGVIQDFQRYKQLETEQKKEQQEELKVLTQKLAMSCQGSLDEEKEKELMKELEIEEDEFLQQYHMKRLMEMKKEHEKRIAMSRPRFGQVILLSDGKQFLEAIDNETPGVVVVIHIYSMVLQSCEAMDGCLKCLAIQYPMVKFCKILATNVNISKSFMQNGLPALLVYKDGQLVGNFVGLEETFGQDFFAADVESFLIENSVLTDESENVVTSVRGTTEDSDADSDLELD